MGRSNRGHGLNMLTTFLLIAGFALAIWIGLACRLGYMWIVAHRAWERNPKRAAVYREHGGAAPPPARWSQLVNVLFSSTPLLLLFSFFSILSLLFCLPCMLWSCVSGGKPGGGLPQPPHML